MKALCISANWDIFIHVRNLEGTSINPESFALKGLAKRGVYACCVV